MASTSTRRRKQPEPPTVHAAVSDEGVAVVRAFIRQQERVRLRVEEMRELHRRAMKPRERRRPL